MPTAAPNIPTIVRRTVRRLLAMTCLADAMAASEVAYFGCHTYPWPVTAGAVVMAAGALWGFNRVMP